MSKIPIKNIYYILCYAWQNLQEDKISKTSLDDFKEPLNLFAKVLASACQYLVKRGLDRSYIPTEEDRSQLKGKIDISSSIQRQTMRKMKMHCIYDEFHHNVLHNQIIKTTLRNLLVKSDVDKSIRSELRSIYIKFSDIEIIELSKSSFSCVKLHRNNSFYQFTLKICELIYNGYLVKDEAGNDEFEDFLLERMYDIFETFLRNFYKIELPKVCDIRSTDIGRTDINWYLDDTNNGDMALLPKMQTDVTITHNDITLIIDAKYYKEALKGQYERKKLISSNLYQMYAYLKNAEQHGGNYLNSTGILIYPQNTSKVDESYNIHGHEIRLFTLDLAQEWQQIHRSLIDLISKYMLIREDSNLIPA